MESFDPVGGGFIVNRILDFFLSPGGGVNLDAISKTLLVFKVLGIALLITFVGGILFVLYQLREFRPRFKLVYDASNLPQQKLSQKRWDDIMRRFEIGMESDWRLAVIEADSLVDEIFKKIGFGGETLAERISSISAQELHSLRELREAHQIRNRLVHTPGFKISRQEAGEALRKYKRVLEELEII